MVFDTGASGILITQEMAKKSNIKPAGKSRFTIADGSVVEFQTTTILSVCVGIIVVNNTQISIAPKAEIGLLSYGFVENYDVKILQTYSDFSERSM
jgi:aspartyl protease family protein